MTPHPRSPLLNPSTPLAPPAPPAPAAPIAVAPLPPTADTAARVDTSVDGVFLSPRVVDRRAFNELSQELRVLVEQAGAERRAVHAALAELTTAARTLQEREAAQHANLALIAKAVKAADERMAKAQGLVDEAHRAASAVDTLDAKADRLIESKLTALEARVDAAQAAAAARVEALEERVRTTSRELEQRLDAIRRDADGLLGPSQSALADCLSRAESLLGCPLARLGPDATYAPGSLGAIVREAGEMGAHADAALRRLAEVQTIAQTSRQAMAGLLDELAGIMGRVDAQRETLAVDAERIREACRQAAATVDERLLLAQRTAADAVEAVRPSLDVITDQARARLEEHALAAGVRLDGATSAALQQLAETTARLMEDADRRIDRIATAGAETTTTLTAAIDRAEQIREPLLAMVTKADDAQNSAALTLRLLERSSAKVDAALAALEPWKGLLAGDDQPPPQIRQIVDGVRRELRSELGTLTAALRSALAGAERAAGSLDTDAPETSAAPAPAALTPTLVDTAETSGTLAAAPARLPAGLSTRLTTSSPLVAMFERPI